MKNNSRIRFLVHFLLWALVSVEVFISTANILALTLNTPEHGYRFSNTQIADITLADGSCKKVTNNNTDRFIPTKTMAEWLSFSSVASFLGVGIGSCIVPTCTDSIQNGTETGVDCGGTCPACPPSYSWQTGSYGSCSASCGPGTMYRSVWCERNDGVTVADWRCGGGKPSSSMSCNDGACPPTCTDGIRNQGEDYVDCGGPNCSACVPINGVCGSSDNSCSSGSPSNFSAGSCGGYPRWDCNGSRGGSSTSCVGSTRNPPCCYPLLGGSSHTTCDCTAAGGSLFDNPDTWTTDYMCIFSSLPGGWSQYGSWAEYDPWTCGTDAAVPRTGPCGTDYSYTTSCTTANRSFSNGAAPTCTYKEAATSWTTSPLGATGCPSKTQAQQCATCSGIKVYTSCGISFPSLGINIPTDNVVCGRAGEINTTCTGRRVKIGAY